MLAPSDFLVLHGPLTEEARHLLPIPVEAALYASDDKKLLWPLLNPDPEQEAGALPCPAKELPHIVEEHLLIPLPWADMPKMALVLRAEDPFLLKKLSPSWQKELQGTLLPLWERLRPIYIDPASELYNQRAASAFLQDITPPSGFFFLLHLVFYKSAAAGSLQKLRELADLLQCFNLGPCFSFGYGVFGLFLQTDSREHALRTAHFLQRQLKRERLHKVQIAFVATGSTRATGKKMILERSWQALAIAEKRGPFGIYDRGHSGRRQRMPFQPQTLELTKAMQGAWRRQSRFTLAAIACAPEADPPQRLDHAFAHGKVYPGHGGDPAFILLADIDPSEARHYITTVWETLLADHGREGLRLGVASWPCLDFKKKDMPALCMKALLHGSFLGPGSMVFLNHLSLNISGDAYFEDGDYRSAICEYRRGLRIQPGEVNLLNSLGVALVECGQEGRAAQCFQDVLQQEADNYMALINLGHVRQAQGAREEALGCFERAWQTFAIANEDAGSGQELFFPLARLYMESADYDKAIAALEQWRARPGNKQDYQLFRLMGQCYMELEEPQKAIRACQHSVRIFPRDSISLSILGLLYVEQGEGSEVGLSLCAKALELDRFNPDLWCRLGQAQRAVGQHDKALAAIRQCLQLRRQHPEGRLQMALLCLALSRKAEAQSRLRRLTNEPTLSKRQARLLQSALASLKIEGHRPEEQA